MKRQFTVQRWMIRIGLLTLVVGMLMNALTNLPLAQAASAGTITTWGDNTAGQLNIPSSLNNVIAVSAKYSHNLALKTNGTIVAWGDNTYGQTNLPSGLNNVTAIAAGGGHSLALKSDGTVVGWGGTGIIDRGQASIPAGLDGVAAISAGLAHSLALKSDGTVVAWGDNNSGQRNIPAGLANVIAIASGNLHNLALKTDGTLAAWGDNSTGQLNIPAGLTNVVAISAGEYHNLALKGDGTVVAWGASSLGRTSVPAGLDHVVAIAAGGSHNLALKSDGKVVAWGDNSAGQLNIPAALTNVVAISAGDNHSLALTSDSALVSGFGSNATGQLAIPARLYNVKSVALGAFNSLAVKSDGTLVAWGATSGTDSGQNNIPAGLNNVVASAAGYVHSLALKSDGTVVAWGNNTFGQTSIPAGLNSVKALSSGLYQGVALKSDGTVAAWGLDSNGQTDVPAGLTNIRAIVSGSQHMLALKGDGTVVGWGDVRLGATIPPAGLDHVIAIAAGGVHSLALKSDGTVVAWGINRNGQLNVPDNLNNVVAITAGAETSMALKADGTVVAWGLNLSGATTVPPSLSNVTAISSGNSGSTLVLYGAGAIDTAPPITRATTDPVAANGANGWFTSDVPVSFSAGDATGSGVKSITYSASGAQPIAATTVNAASASRIINANGTTTISYYASDNAGNVEAAQTLTIKLDKILPTITASAQTADGRAYLAGTWTNQNVTVSFSCSDATSGIATGACPAAIVTSAEGTTSAVNGTVSDQAGNSKSASFGPILIDKTVPTATAAPDRTPDSNGWYNAPVGFSFSGVDNLSGSGGVTCNSAKTYSGPDSATASITGSCTDAAGNAGAATASFKYDAGGPAIAVDSRTAANAAGWNNSAVTIRWACSDAISGALSASVSQTISVEGANQSATGSCADNAGNSASDTQTGVNIDTTAPTISAAAASNPNASGWYNGNVSVAFTCADTLSGVASCPANQTMTSDGASISSTAQSVSDRAGNSSAPSNIVTVKIDRTAPTVSVTGVSNGAIYPLGSVPTAGCSTTDALSGVATQATLSISGGNADGSGSYTATCAGASDIAGNAGSASVTYSVAYRWSGFFQPVDNLPTVNSVKAGQAIPVKFSLGGNYGLNIFAAGYPKVQVVSCTSGAPTDEIEQTVTAGGSSLNYDAASGQYNYVWKTDKAWAGSCRQLIVRLVDGTDHVALFQFR